MGLVCGASTGLALDQYGGRVWGYYGASVGIVWSEYRLRMRLVWGSIL